MTGRRLGPAPIPAWDRFWSKVLIGDGCWMWTASLDTGGYGLFASSAEKKHRAHRYAYELLVGPIPGGLTIDHLCRVKACVNPWHLEPVTMKENNLRGNSPSALNARKTHCKWGHPLSGENLYLSRLGYRQCRACNRIIAARLVKGHQTGDTE